MTARSFSAPLDAAQLHQLQRGQDRRERIAQLVAEHGQELVLGAAGLLELAQQRLALACVCSSTRRASTCSVTSTATAIMP